MISLGVTERWLKPYDFLCVRAAVGRIDFEIVEIGPATSREEKAGWMSLEFEVLQIVIVPGQIEGDAVLTEQRIPVVDERGVVAVRSIRINRMVRDHDQVWCASRTLQLVFKPGKLLRLLLPGQRKVAAG